MKVRPVSKVRNWREKMKLTRQFYYYLANKIIERFDLEGKIFPNQLAELFDNWIWRWNTDMKKKRKAQFDLCKCGHARAAHSEDGKKCAYHTGKNKADCNCSEFVQNASLEVKDVS